MANRTADVIVVGGGVHGCSTAYNLAKEGVNVVLFEARYLSYGGSGRSAAGLRQHFGTEVNCRLAKYNLECFQTLQEDLGGELDLEFTQWGYLWVSYSESSLEQLKKNVALQRSLDIPSVILTPEEIKERWPYLNTDGVLGGAFCDRDGHINPHTLTIAYGREAERRGARVFRFTPVERLLAEKGKITGVVAKGETWSAPVVVLNAGAWSVPLAEQVGVKIPVYPERHQALITEPVEPIQAPMILCLDDGAYFKQCPNGTFFLGQDNPNEPKTTDVLSTHQFLDGVTKSVVKKMPLLKGVRVVRQWSGPYDNSPDHQAIVGGTPVQGLFVNCGWSGHGLQFGPSGGRLMKELVMGEPTFVDIHRFRLSRFEENDLFFEPAYI